METGDPAMNSVHRGLLTRSFQRVHSQLSSALSSDTRHRSVCICCSNDAPVWQPVIGWNVAFTPS